MYEKKYVMPRGNKGFLERHGFHYSKVYSTEDEVCYIKRIPVYTYGEYITLSSEIKVYLPSKEVRIDVFDGNSHSYYAGYYVRDYGDVSAITDVVDRNIAREMKKLGIVLKGGEHESADEAAD